MLRLLVFIELHLLAAPGVPHWLVTLDRSRLKLFWCLQILNERHNDMPAIRVNIVIATTKGNGKRRKSRIIGRNKAREIYLLSGLIYCGNCGGAMAGNRRAGGAGGIYSNYECNARKRTKNCDMSSIAKRIIEGAIISYLEKHIFSSEGIGRLAKQVAEYADRQRKHADCEIRRLRAQLQGVETEINNLVEAIAQGMFHQSMKQRLSQLETRQAELRLDIEAAKYKSGAASLPMDGIRAYLRQYDGLNKKAPDVQRRIIQAFVQKVNVLKDNTVEITTSVDFNGGGEEDRTLGLTDANRTLSQLSYAPTTIL